MTRSQQYRRFMELMPIRTRDRRIVPIRFNEAQEILWSKIAPKLDRRERIWMIILKARREGVSTLIEDLLLAHCVIEDHVQAMVMASFGKNTKVIWEMAERMVKHSPLRSVAKIVNKSIQLGESVLNIQTAGTEDATRGFDFTCLHGSEVASWANPGAMLAAMQCLPFDEESFCFFESTAKGKAGDGALFYEEWCRAVAGKSDLIPVFLPWFAMPSYRLIGKGIEDMDVEEQALVQTFQLTHEQLAWRRFCISTMCQGSLDKFHQEYPATAEEAFIHSNLPFFTTAELLPFQRDICPGKRYHIDPAGKIKPDPSGPLEIWSFPREGRKYVIGADSSMGSADEDRSKSTCEILDMETLEQVAEYEAASAPHAQAQHMAGMGRLYNNALLAPEVQSNGGGGGRALIYFIQQQDYWHIYQWKHWDKVRQSQGVVYGWETNARTRPIMLSQIRQVVQEKCCIIRSAKLLSQFADFGQNDQDRYEAETGHDDLIFAFGIALCVRAQNYVKMAAPAVSTEEPDWKKLGITVRGEPETRASWRTHQPDDGALSFHEY